MLFEIKSICFEVNRCFKSQWSGIYKLITNFMEDSPPGEANSRPDNYNTNKYRITTPVNRDVHKLTRAQLCTNLRVRYDNASIVYNVRQITYKGMTI
jgi:hypothetical protein